MSAEATRRLHWPHDPHCRQPRRISGDSLDHSWRRIELKLSVRCSMRSPPPAAERVMADFPCASTKRTSHWPAPMSREAPVRFRVSVVVAALVLTGCNANQAINPSGQAGRCANDAAILTIPSATHRTTPGTAAAAANRRRSSRSDEGVGLWIDHATLAALQRARGAGGG
jgi:hypothetical protein